jgi:hypothetical protein
VPAGCHELSRHELEADEQANKRHGIISRDSDIHLLLSGWVPAYERVGTRFEMKEKNMPIKLNALCLGGFLTLTSFLGQAAKADEWNKKIEFQFSTAVQIPGKVLPAGKYVFQLLDSQTDRNIVQVFSENSDGKDSLVATLIAVPDFMAHTPDKPILHFDERPAGTPEAIHSYFYPGDNTGWEFIYPKGAASQATQP